MDVDAYLDRIGYSGSREASFAVLRDLHAQHLESVPFENLDIREGRRIVLSREILFDKIVKGRRGGFCYELNGLFAWLLVRLGFGVTLLSGRVTDSKGGFGPEFDHMALMVRIEERRWLADVGYGDSFVFPLALDTSGAQEDPAGSFRVETAEPELTVSRRQPDGSWRDEYRFTLAPRALNDYAEMCDYHQTSPDSPFTRKVVCSRRTSGGRITLTADRLIVTTGSGREETALPDKDAWQGALRENFGITL